MSQTVSETSSFISTSPIFTERTNATGKSWINKNLFKSSKKTHIGNDVWIGYGALIKSGVKIGDGAIIGAGAVFTKDVPSYTIVGGIPARHIRKRFSENIINILLEIKWWNMPDKLIKKNIHLFQKENLTIEELKDFQMQKTTHNNK